MSEFFYTADGVVHNIDLIENMSNDEYYLDGSIRIGGSVISNKFVNEAGEPIGLPKNVDVKGSLKVKDETELGKALIKNNLKVNGLIEGNVLSVNTIRMGNLTLENKDNSLRIRNPYGFIDVGTKNNMWGHIYTDRPNFALNKQLVHVGSLPYTNYVKYSADGGIVINDFDLKQKKDDLIVNNSKSNKTSMTIHRDGTVSLVNKLQPKQENIMQSPPSSPKQGNMMQAPTPTQGNMMQSPPSSPKQGNMMQAPTPTPGNMMQSKPKLITDIEKMNPIGWFDATDFNESTQKWTSKVGNRTINARNVKKASNPFPFIFGDTNATLTDIPWSGRNKDYTFIHLAKYNGNTRGRIWTGMGSNWLSGFWNNSVAFYHEGWFDYAINASNGGRDWLLSVDMNNFVRVNRGSYQKYGPAFSPESIAVNTRGEVSDFAIAEFLIFNKKLSQAEYAIVEEYLTKKYGILNVPRDLTLSNIKISNIQPSKPKLITDIENMNPLGWFDSYNFDENTQKWNSRDKKHVINARNVKKASSPFPFVFGATNASLRDIPWPGKNRDYTFIHLAKYNGNTRRRIWTGIGNNWLSGFWNNGVGFYHEGWFDAEIRASNGGRDWLLSVDMNNFVRVNRGTYQKNGPAFSPQSIAINSDGETSDFAVAEFLIFNRKLTQSEYAIVEEYLVKKYGLFGTAIDVSLSSVSSSNKMDASWRGIANDVRSGKYNKINNKDFIITNNLNYWKLTIEFNSNDYFNSWQSLVGNMYNREVPGRGWGVWVSPSGVLHWSGSSTTNNLNGIGRLTNGHAYRLIITYSNNTYNFNLFNLSFNKAAQESFNKTSSMITDKGFVTFGGMWENNSNERFKGNINSVQVSNY
jgi:hypothetical protein